MSGEEFTALSSGHRHLVILKPDKIHSIIYSALNSLSSVFLQGIFSCSYIIPVAPFPILFQAASMTRQGGLVMVSLTV